MKTDLIKRVEWGTALLISLLILVLLVVRAQHAGGLWRDECTSVRLAGLSSIAEISVRYPYPLLHPAIVRVHTVLFGSSDVSLRILGVETGVALIGVVWLAGWAARTGTPLILLPLVGLNALVLTWGATIRGYGMGTIAMILAIGMAARVLIKPTRLGLVMLFLALFAGPQLLVHDSPLIFAIVGAAVLVCLARRRIGLGFILIGIGGLIGLACVPYVLGNYQRARWVVLKFPTSLEWIWHNLAAACGPPDSIMPVVWCALLVLAIGAAIWRLIKIWPDRFPDSDRLAFAVLVAALSVPGYFVFLRMLNYWPHPWYYLPLLGVLATAIELMIAGWLHVRWIRVARIGFAGVISMILAIAAWPRLFERQTNVDLIAYELEKTAESGDLIVVNPWDHGVTFHRYFRGTTRWVTIPMMDDHRGHRYDLLKAKMVASDPLADLFEAITQTLQSGARVWLVGGAQFLKPGEVPHWLPPAPNSQFGWNNDAYRNSWSQQLGAFIQLHAERADLIPGPGDKINEVEKDDVWLVEGWRQ